MLSRPRLSILCGLEFSGQKLGPGNRRRRIEITGVELKRTMGLVRATAMVVGTIIGASIFVQPSVITAEVLSAKVVFAVWAVSGALPLFGALV